MPDSAPPGSGPLDEDAFPVVFNPGAHRQRLGFVTGLAAEAKLLRNSGFMVAVGGGTPDGAHKAAEALLAQGAVALISFGLAGGLSPKLPSGTILVPNAVIDDLQTYPCDYSLMEFLGGSTRRPILAGRRIAETANDKAMLFNRTPADAIDLESGAVARVALSANVPFAALRAVTDPAAHNLPPAALIPLNPDGSVNLPQILLSVFSHPGQIPSLLALANHAARARHALAVRLKKIS